MKSHLAGLDLGATRGGGGRIGICDGRSGTVEPGSSGISTATIALSEAVERCELAAATSCRSDEVGEPEMILDGREGSWDKGIDRDGDSRGERRN